MQDSHETASLSLVFLTFFSPCLFTLTLFFFLAVCSFAILFTSPRRFR
jgi:hypothetical protein